MTVSLSKSSRIIFSVSSLGLFVLALIWVSYFRQSTFDRRDAIRFGIEKNSNLVVALEQYAISTVRNADAVLQLIRTEYAREGLGFKLEEILPETRLNR
ncbi:MAG TPA: hypothetical protein VNS32_28965, partial [Flavisolibacter sp.]|nr:hypothetical protein [Flavisolibacter sp.]